MNHETLPLYVIMKALEQKTKIGLIFPRFELAIRFCDKIATITKEITDKYQVLKYADFYRITIGDSELMFFPANQEYTYSRRLDEYIFVGRKDISNDLIETVMAGFGVIADNVIVELGSDISIIKRNNNIFPCLQ